MGRPWPASKPPSVAAILTHSHCFRLLSLGDGRHRYPSPLLSPPTSSPSALFRWRSAWDIRCLAVLLSPHPSPSPPPTQTCSPGSPQAPSQIRADRVSSRHSRLPSSPFRGPFPSFSSIVMFYSRFAARLLISLLLLQLAEPLTGKIWTLDDFESCPALLVRLFSGFVYPGMLLIDHILQFSPEINRNPFSPLSLSL